MPDRSREPGKGASLDDVLRRFRSHMENVHRHLDEAAARDPGMGIDEAGLAHQLEETEIPDDRREEVLAFVEHFLEMDREMMKNPDDAEKYAADASAVSAMERLHERLKGGTA